jgi:hypothetical protein
MIKFRFTYLSDDIAFAFYFFACSTGVHPSAWCLLGKYSTTEVQNPEKKSNFWSLSPSGSYQ